MNRRKSYSTSYLLNHPVLWQSLLRTVPEEIWLRRGRVMSRRLAEEMVRRVPAYGKFCADSALVSGTVSSGGFSDLPITDKETYLRKYGLADLCWDGDFNHIQSTVSATSGSSGEPFYFPRSALQDLQYSAIAEMYLRNNFSIQTKSTLYVVGWGMGVWIGGVFSYQAVRLLAERGKYPLSIITPGTSADEILNAVQKLGPSFDQVIIGGYPPMIKDTIDEGIRRGFGWKKYRIRFIFSAEGFSEAFRDYVMTNAGLTDTYRDTLNHYGTVDLGTMAHETPLSILVRRLALSRPELNKELFGHSRRQPTFAQYIPELFYFEEKDGRLLCSARSGIPLVRYDLLDTGGVKTFAVVREICARHGVRLDREIRSAGIADTIWQLPFVYVFERADFTVKFSGANIYPEEIRRALEHTESERFLTGKCTLEIVHDTRMNQQLLIHLELRNGQKPNPSLVKSIPARIVSGLLETNSEYAYLYRSLSKRRMTPHIKLWPWKSAPYFSVQGKHRWVRKDA